MHHIVNGLTNYSVRLSQDGWDSPEVRCAWATLIAGRCDPDLLGKSPEFLEHLFGTRDASQFHLATLRDGSRAIVGVVPLRVRPLRLRFDVAGNVLWECRRRAVVILGSLPLLPPDPALYDLLFAALDEEFAGCDAIAMPSVPADSFLWRYVRASPRLQARFLRHEEYGVRGCPTIPLPATVDEYLRRFGAKKRYNLKRQVRVLRDRCGGRLELRRIEFPHQVADLVSALDATRWPGSFGRFGRSHTPAVDRRAAEDLAGRGLLMVYLLMGAGRPCAALMGLRYQGVYHLSSIPRDRSLDRLSPGSTALHLAIEDLICHTSIAKVDLGFGEPTYPHSSTNVVEPRASLLLFRKTLANRLLRNNHVVFQSLVKLGKLCVTTHPLPSRSKNSFPPRP